MLILNSLRTAFAMFIVVELFRIIFSNDEWIHQLSSHFNKKREKNLNRKPIENLNRQ